MSKDTLSEKAYQDLKKKISNLKSGSYLSTRQFASEIGMSYTPVREAFLRLKKEGTLRQIPKVGFFVETMDLEDLIQTYQVRECIEPFVLEKVFHRFKPEDTAKMRKLQSQQKDALSAADFLQYMHLDKELHEVMFRIYGNKHLLNMYRNIREQYMFCSNRITNSLYSGAVDEHIEFIEAIETGDKEKAIELLRSHIENAKQNMKEGYINVMD